MIRKSLLAILKYPKAAISVIIMLTLLASWQLQYIELDNDIMNYLPRNHPARKSMERVKEQYGDSDMVLVTIKALKGTIFQKEILSICD